MPNPARDIPARIAAMRPEDRNETQQRIHRQAQERAELERRHDEAHAAWDARTS